MHRARRLLAPSTQIDGGFRLSREPSCPVQQLGFSAVGRPHHSILADAPQTVPALRAGASRQEKNITGTVTHTHPALVGSWGRTDGFDHLRPDLTFLRSAG